MTDIHRVLVLGHTGFIGARVWDELRRRSPAVEAVGRSFPELDLTRGDHVEQLAPLLDARTAVVMLSGIKRQLGDTLEIFYRNLQMVTHLCRLVEAHPCARLVYVSSGAVYGEEIHNLQMTEETPAVPVSYYGIAKFASERLLANAAARRVGMTLVCLRPPLTYGPGDASRSYGPSAFVKLAVEGKEIALWGDGSELREVLFVDDLGRMIHDLVFADYHGVLNAVTGQSHTFREMIEILNRLCGGRLVVTSRPRSKGKVDNAYVNRRLLKVLPNFAFTSLEEGIRRAWEAEKAAGAPPA